MSNDSLMRSVFLSSFKTFRCFALGMRFGLRYTVLYSCGRTPWGNIRFANPDPGCLVNSDLDLDSGFWFPTIKQNWNIFLLRHPGVTSNLRKHDISLSFFVEGPLLHPGSGSNPWFQIYNSDHRPIESGVPRLVWKRFLKVSERKCFLFVGNSWVFSFLARRIA